MQNRRTRSRPGVLEGYTLAYDGAIFTDRGLVFSCDPIAKMTEFNPEIPPHTNQFCAIFNELGALIMRWHFAHAQRSALIAQVLRHDYANNRVQDTAPGADQTDMFSVTPDMPQVVRENIKLQAMALYPLGETKFLNRLAQPIRQKNHESSGEQGLFGVLHIGVWQPIINLPFELQKHGFRYVPAHGDEKNYRNLEFSLQKGNYKFDSENELLIVSGDHSQQISLVAFSDVVMELQDRPNLTFQANGFLISNKKSATPIMEPLGWIVHLPTGKILKQEDTEDLLRLIRLGVGKFHQLNQLQQDLLLAGRLANNERVRFIQNRQLNAILALFATFEKEYGFNPEPLISNLYKLVYKKAKEVLDGSDVVDDILTGVLQSEMIQHLVVTRSASNREELPPNFSQDFRVTQNNVKALAHAFTMVDGNGQSIIHRDANNPVFYQSEYLPDVGISGDLMLPSLSDARHCAAVLSTAILVAEQMIMEQLLSLTPRSLEAYVTKDDYIKLMNQFDIFLKEHKEMQPGLQNPASYSLLETVRIIFGTRQLLKLANLLSTNGHSSPEECIKDLSSEELTAYEKSIQILYMTCELLQSNRQTSAASVGSRGAILGVEALIRKLFPNLVIKFGVSLNSTASAIAKEQCLNPTLRLSSSTAFACPYLNARTRSYNLPGATQQHLPKPILSVASNKPRQVVSTNWCGFFTRAVLLVGVTTGLAIAATVNSSTK